MPLISGMNKQRICWSWQWGCSLLWGCCNSQCCIWLGVVVVLVNGLCHWWHRCNAAPAPMFDCWCWCLFLSWLAWMETRRFLALDSFLGFLADRIRPACALHLHCFEQKLRCPDLLGLTGTSIPRPHQLLHSLFSSTLQLINRFISSSRSVSIWGNKLSMHVCNCTRKKWSMHHACMYQKSLCRRTRQWRESRRRCTLGGHRQVWVGFSRHGCTTT